MSDNNLYFPYEKKQRGALWFLQLILVCGIVIWLLNPISSNMTILAILTMAWVLTTAIIYGDCFTNIFVKGSILKVFLWPIILFLYGIMGHASFSTSYIMYIFIFEIGLFYLMVKDRKTGLILSILSLVYLSIISINTLILYQIKPNISRILAYGDPDKIAKYGGDEYMTPFTAGYDIVYGIVFITCFLLSIRSTKTGILQKLSLPLIILYSIFILRAQYFIALVLWFVSIAVTIISKQSNRKAKIIYILFSSLLIVSISVFGSKFLLYLSDVPNIGYNFSAKLKEVANLLSGSQDITGSDAASRSYYYSISISNFIDHFFIGAGNINNLYIGYGNHSTILDAFAQFGIIGGVPFFFFYVTHIVLIQRELKSHSKRCYSNLIILLAILGTFNRATTRANYALIYIVIPLMMMTHEFSMNKANKQCNYLNQENQNADINNTFMVLDKKQ